MILLADKIEPLDRRFLRAAQRVRVGVPVAVDGNQADVLPGLLSPETAPKP